jgi:hypothetical protein
MLQTTRLWKVRLTHRLGYEAPHFFVETESTHRERYHEAEEEAIKEAEKRTRLTDFPNSWIITVEKVNKVLRNGKWIDPSWVNSKS